MILPGFTWEQYLAIDLAFTGSGVRVRFLDDQVELMAPLSEEHQDRSSLLRRLVESWCFRAGIRLFYRSNSPMHLAGEAGCEPAEAYCFGEKKTLPDLIIEIAPASGGLSPRAFYQRFEVPELWIWRHGVLEVFHCGCGSRAIRGVHGECGAAGTGAPPRRRMRQDAQRHRCAHRLPPKDWRLTRFRKRSPQPSRSAGGFTM